MPTITKAMFFVDKFYCKKDRHSDNKYSKIVNRGDVGNILISCASVAFRLLKDYPMASFGFAGARTIDAKSKTVETYKNNQRFRTYRYAVVRRFGEDRFAHNQYPTTSSYLLVNKSTGNVDAKGRQPVKMFSETYVTLPDV